jgi:polyhydroxyalkanoate synthesis regulator phasin
LELDLLKARVQELERRVQELEQALKEAKKTNTK